MTSSFGRRSPVYKEERPLSPVLVYILNLLLLDAVVVVVVESLESRELTTLVLVIGVDFNRVLVQPEQALEASFIFKKLLASIFMIIEKYIKLTKKLCDEMLP